MLYGAERRLRLVDPGSISVKGISRQLGSGCRFRAQSSGLVEHLCLDENESRETSASLPKRLTEGFILFSNPRKVRMSIDRFHRMFFPNLVWSFLVGLIVTTIAAVSLPQFSRGSQLFLPFGAHPAGSLVDVVFNASWVFIFVNTKWLWKTE